MPLHTTVEIYSHILNVMNKIGITPIYKELVTHSKSEAIAPKIVNNNVNKNEIGKQGSNITTTNCSKNFIIENHHQHRDTTPGKISAFPIFRFGNKRNKSLMFWLLFIFFYGTAIPSIYKLIVTMQETKLARATMSSEGNLTTGTPILVASFVWVVYSLTCCAVYFVYFFKADQLCRFLTNWQIVEGDLITESKAMHASGSSIESFIKWQKKGLLLYTAGIPLSFILMGFASTYNVKFPMYIYASVPAAWVEGREWIQPLCFIFAWIQVGLFIICESQTELITIAYTRSIYRCLQILNQPATDFYKRFKNSNRHQSPHHVDDATIVTLGIQPIESIHNKNTKTDSPNQKLEMLLLFYDSVERYESLNQLMDEFNSIFAWPLFTRKAFTMAKICCYVYLLLRHPLDSAFPGFVIFLYAALAIFAKFGSILSLMASVRGESEKFLREWEKVLLVLFPNGVSEEERRLKRNSTFGFRMGNFYTVISQTLLTFSSVVLTYLIILLQI